MMKKRIVALAAAVVAAFTVHGASLNWTVTQVQNSDGVSGVAQGYVAYMFATAWTGNVSSFVPGASLTTAAVVEAAIKDGSFSAAGAYHSGFSNASGLVPSATGVSNSFDNGDSITAFAVIFDAADYASAKNYIITGEKTTSWGSAIGVKTLAYGSMRNAEWLAISAVPEPTSGLLALIGFAGLALRRRRG